MDEKLLLSRWNNNRIELLRIITNPYTRNNSKIVISGIVDDLIYITSTQNNIVSIYEFDAVQGTNRLLREYYNSPHDVVVTESDDIFYIKYIIDKVVYIDELYTGQPVIMFELQDSQSAGYFVNYKLSLISHYLYYSGKLYKIKLFNDDGFQIGTEYQPYYAFIRNNILYSIYKNVDDPRESYHYSINIGPLLSRPKSARK